MAKPARGEVMEVGDLFGDPGIATPARTAAPHEASPVDTAQTVSNPIDAAEITRVDPPGIELFKSANYRWCELTAPWVGIQILLFKERAVHEMWDRAGKVLQAAVMRWLPEYGREIVRDALRGSRG